MSQAKDVEILLVEDNPSDAELTIRALKKHNCANHLVHVKDGEQALSFLFDHGGPGARGAEGSRAAGPQSSRSEGRPKVVLLDLKLPKVDGLEVLRRLKADAATRPIPVVVLTSSQEEKDIVESYKLGVNSYVTKPVGFDQFAKAASDLGLYWLLLNQAPR